jgi:PIN domain nuclease of toxin-antitoxin system
MQILLDTHILLWWLADDVRLKDGARRLIADPANRIVVSAASAWEIAIKQGLGALSIDGDVEESVCGQGFELLPITFAHAAEVLRLPPIHRDPFDRMLIAQARVENLHLLTADSRLLAYPVEAIGDR